MPSIKRIVWWISPLVVIAALFYQFYGQPAPQGYVWEESYDRALMRAQSEGRDVLLLTSDEGCPWCRRMKSETLSDERVARYLADRFVLLFLEAPSGRAEFAKSGLAIEGVPATIVIDASGVERMRIEGFYPPDEYLQKISSGLQTELL